MWKYFIPIIALVLLVSSCGSSQRTASTPVPTPAPAPTPTLTPTPTPTPEPIGKADLLELTKRLAAIEATIEGLEGTIKRIDNNTKGLGITTAKDLEAIQKQVDDVGKALWGSTKPFVFSYGGLLDTVDAIEKNTTTIRWAIATIQADIAEIKRDIDSIKWEIRAY